MTVRTLHLTNPLDATGRTALIVGGTAGIGHAAAKLLVELGATVFVAGRSEEQGLKAAAEIGATYIRADVVDTESVDSAVRSWLSVQVGSTGQFIRPQMGSTARPRRCRTPSSRMSWMSM